MGLRTGTSDSRPLAPMTDPSILITDCIADEGLALLKEGGAHVDYAPGLPKDELLERIQHHDALIVRSETKVTRDLLERATKLRIIGRAGVGVDNIDVTSATEHRILVVNAPDGNTVAAAEHTIALLLGLARQVAVAAASLASGSWERSRFLGMQIRGKTLGIIGFGRIGRTVADIARNGLHMEVLAFDPYCAPSEMEERHITPMRDLDSLLCSSDAVSLHVPLTADTTTLIGTEELHLMQPHALLLNVARGGLVDEEAVVAALDAGMLGGAAFDVFATEPLPQNSPLRTHPRILVTPHLGASTHDAQRFVAIDVAEQVLRFLHGETPTSGVNLAEVLA